MAEKKTAKGRATKKATAKSSKSKSKARKKAPAKKVSTKRVPTKKAPTKKTTIRKAPAKKAAVKKASAKKTSAGRDARRTSRTSSPAPAASEERYERHEPERSQPHRSWHGPPAGTEMPYIGPFGTREPWSPESSVDEAGSRMGYDVVNHHIHEGWDASQEPRYGTESPFAWLAGQARHGLGPGAAAGQRWLEGLEALGSILRALGLPKNLGFRQAPSSEDLWKVLGFNRGESGPSPETREPFVLRVASRRPVEVQVDLGPSDAKQGLRAHLSHTDEGYLGRVIAVQVSSESGRVCVSFEVADEMPSGVYSGAFMDPGVAAAGGNGHSAGLRLSAARNSLRCLDLQ